MPAAELKREGDVFILTMAKGDNRFNPPFLEGMNRALDTVDGLANACLGGGPGVATVIEKEG
jgi:hypothetical protein